MGGAPPDEDHTKPDGDSAGFVLFVWLLAAIISAVVGAAVYGSGYAH